MTNVRCFVSDDKLGEQQEGKLRGSGRETMRMKGKEEAVWK